MADLDKLTLLTIKVKRIHPEARLPVRATRWAAGADIACAEPFRIGPGERMLVPTGLIFEIPPGFYGRVAPRSGLAVRNGIDVLAGVIDADYRGECRVALINLGQSEVNFSAGERIAQLIIERIAVCEYSWSESLSDTERADGGFGSTGS